MSVLKAIASNSGGGGGGTISSITSTGSTISVTNPSGPITNVDIALSHNNTWPSIQTFNIVNIPTTTNTPIGLIEQNGTPLLHTYTPATAGTLPNLFLGNNVGNFTTTSLGAGYGANIGIGVDVLANNTTGFQNTALGYRALWQNTEGSGNVALGYQALRFNTTGGGNFALGFNTLASNLDGIHNLAIGESTLALNDHGTGNIGFGYQSNFNNISNYNIGIGYFALRSNTTGTGNVGIAVDALFSNTTGNYSVGIGFAAGFYATTGASDNIFIGFQAGDGDETAPYRSLIDTRCIYLGEYTSREPGTAPNSNPLDRAIAIGFNAKVGANNSCVLGGSGADALNFGVQVTVPTARIHLPAGTATAGTAPLKLTSGTALSSAEDGVMEYDSSHLYFTIGSTRYQLDQQTGAPGLGAVLAVSNDGGAHDITNVGNATVSNLTSSCKFAASDKYACQGNDGFTGSGLFTSLTFVGGICTNAS